MPPRLDRGQPPDRRHESPLGPACGLDPTDPNKEFAFALTGLEIDFAKLTSLSFTIRGDDHSFIDELRIGDSYGSVVPEPAAAALLLLGFATLGAFARMRRRRER